MITNLNYTTTCPLINRCGGRCPHSLDTALTAAAGVHRPRSGTRHLQQLGSRTAHKAATASLWARW
jgi:hypothetical protein